MLLLKVSSGLLVQDIDNTSESHLLLSAHTSLGPRLSYYSRLHELSLRLFGLAYKWHTLGVWLSISHLLVVLRHNANFDVIALRQLA